MELRNLTTFVDLANSRNFTKTALSLGYSQSAVTAQIKQIERELGAPVFDRLGKTISLTSAGKILYDYATRMLTLEQEAIYAIQKKSEMTGELRMAIEESLAISFLPDILHYYRSRHPEVDLIVKAADSKTMFQLLKENELDLIYTLDNLYDRPELVRPRELAEPIYFIAPAQHPFVSRSNVSIAEIVKEPFIFASHAANYRSELEKQLSLMGLEIKPFLEVGNTDIICRLVSKGIGLSFVPACVARPYFEDGSIRVLNVPEVDICMYRQMLFYKGKWQTPPMKAMIQLLINIDF